MATNTTKERFVTNVLILGQGGREHAFGWKLAQEGVNLYFGPGNAGTRKLGHNLDFVDLESDDISREVIDFCQKEQIDFSAVLQEDLLQKALVNKLTRAGIPTFGATLQASIIEWSKVWTNRFLDLYGIPHARGVELTSPDFELVLPANFRVVKADGLARGKGVRIAQTSDQVREVIKKLQIDFPRAAEQILVQEFLPGREVSFQAFSDGKKLIFLPPAIDFKRIGEGNQGENSGGVGSFCIDTWLMRHDEGEVKIILQSLVDFLSLNGRPFFGLIYGGFVLTKNGPKLIEVNARPGDPETQVILPRLQSKLFPILQQSAAGSFEETNLAWDSRVAVCVVLCSEGYPSKPIINRVIYGLNDLPEDILVFHSGTTLNDKRELVTTGGRVLSVVALGDSLEEARTRVYEAIKQVHFEGMYFRSDIALNV